MNNFLKLQPSKVGGVPGASLASVEVWIFPVSELQNAKVTYSQ